MAKLLQLWWCATSKCLIYEISILFHNEAAIRIKQTASLYKRLNQQHRENILKTNYILRCANGLFSKLWIHFNPVNEEQYYFRIPFRPYRLFYMTQISGLFSFSVALYSTLLTTHKLYRCGWMIKFAFWGLVGSVLVVFRVFCGWSRANTGTEMFDWIILKPCLSFEAVFKAIKNAAQCVVTYQMKFTAGEYISLLVRAEIITQSWFISAFRGWS